ncbi:MAG: 2-C-methyl-D-erythritol 4-phosphate cytidylyltransferase [Acetivibrio sp.]
MKTTAIILSGGKGKRMETNIPKQYLELDGKPILYYTIKAFEKSEVDDIIVVVGRDDIEYCKKNIIEKYDFKKVKAIIAGGKERYDSVYNGINKAEDADYIFIHDGARPLIHSQEINNLKKRVQKDKACIAGMPAKDTIKIVGEENMVEKTLNRKDVWIVQTPQVFAYSLIKNAYDLMMSENKEDITDDAMVLERYGTHPVTMVKTSYKNIKITTPEDIMVAEALLKADK